MMACVWAISSWGLGTRGTRGGRIVAVPVDCNRNHILSKLNQHALLPTDYILSQTRSAYPITALLYPITALLYPITA